MNIPLRLAYSVAVLARHMFGRPRKGHTETDRLDLYSLYLAAARAT